MGYEEYKTEKQSSQKYYAMPKEHCCIKDSHIACTYFCFKPRQSD